MNAFPAFILLKILITSIMKKLFLLSIALLSHAVTAQDLIWANSFDTPDDLQGWTFHDLNNNGNKWTQGQNMFRPTTTMQYGTEGVLRHSISLVPSGFVQGLDTENDWAISPEIDLSSAGGTLTLVASIGRMRVQDNMIGRNLYIYVSTPEKPVPTLSDFQAQTSDPAGNEYYIVAGNTQTPFPPTISGFVESLVDISAFAGKKIYIGLWTNKLAGFETNASNININEMSIYATETLGTKDVKKNKILTRITENPVKENLQLQLNPALKENATKINIYNTAGQKVVAAQYSKSISTVALSTGKYIVEVTDGKTTETLSFIKK